MAFGTPPAYMGFVGYCQFIFGSNNNTFFSQTQKQIRQQVRLESCDLKLQQPINKPNITDIRYDKNVYTILPQTVSGSLRFPVIFVDNNDRGNNITKELYDYVTDRNYQGRLKSFDVAVKYTTSDASLLYKKCYINSFSFSVEQQGVMATSIDVIGYNRTEHAFRPQDVTNSRIGTWADFFVDLSGEIDISGSYFRNFEINISNNIEPMYTANGKLVPQDLTPTNRDITGQFTLMGRHIQLSNYARNNPSRCYEDGSLIFGFDNPCSTSRTSAGNFNAKIPNMIFEIEEISMSNDVIDTIVKWHSIPTDHNLENLTNYANLSI